MLKALFRPDVPFESLYIPYIYKEIYFDGVYNDIFNGAKDFTVIDVGANIGVVTDYMRQYCKKLYAIEPSKEHFEALKQNKEYNGWDNVEIFNIALADKDGEMDLFLNSGNRTMHSLQHGKQAEESGAAYAVGNSPQGNYDKSEKVKTVAFDTFINENKIEKVDFCKFDVEGAEDRILYSEGFKKICHKIKAIEVEFHFPDWPKYIDYMKSLGYGSRRYDSSAIIVLFVR
jgi:FkbM family methyltransferase